MTKEDIICMAKNSGLFVELVLERDLDWLERFAKLVAQHEREWVELDDEDYIKAYELCDFDKVAAFDFFESKLKEKNS